jgi:type I restriction enzyme R subunit
VPAVQIELKTLGINPRRAMEQIVEYKNDPGNGYSRTLLCFVQLFVVSNRDSTYYFANNNTRHFAFNAEERFLPIYQHAAEDNSKITHLDDFAEKFLAKCTLGQMISRYMVPGRKRTEATGDAAVSDLRRQTHRRLHRPRQRQWLRLAYHGQRQDAHQLQSLHAPEGQPAIEKCIFVVDRKDLDRQTREEFNRFQEGCVEQNTNA